ncbi:MAG: hypothetical protein ABIT07_05415 [Ferruginibacter sp.]
MKKIISVIVSGVLITSLFTNFAAAQQGNDFSYSGKNAGKSFLPQIAELTPVPDNTSGTSKADLKLMKANMKAAKAELKATTNFNRVYKNAPDVKWVVEEKALVGFFNQDDKRSMVAYNKKGNWMYTIVNYSADKLSATTRNMIQEAFKHFKITLVQEISQGDVTVLEIHLQLEDEYKNILVYEGEIINL